MTTPIYKGQPPAASSGWLGGLGAWFGGVSTPTYAGTGQPPPGTSGHLAGSMPAYKPAPVKPSPAPTPAAPAATAASTASTCPAPSGAAPTDAGTTPDGPCPMDLPSFVLAIPRRFEP